jgi:5-methylcytosine-specific restriction endonuclease McrA
MKTRKKPSPEILTLDSLCRQYVFLRDRFLCVKCLHLTKRRNGDRLQWAHIHTRGVHSLRWIPENSVVLCSGCHLKGHLHPLEFSRWFEEQYPDRVKYLTLLRQTPRKVDRVGMRLWLESQIKRLEST